MVAPSGSSAPAGGTPRRKAATTAASESTGTRVSLSAAAFRSSSGAWGTSSAPDGGSSGSAKDTSTAAVELRRSSSIPCARLSSSSWGLMPSDRVSRAISRLPTTRGTLPARLKLNCPSRRRMSCSSAISMRLRITPFRWATGMAAKRGLIWAVPAEKAQTTSPSWKTIPASPSPVRMESAPVFLLKETIWMISRSGRSSRLPVRLKRAPGISARAVRRFYTAARISSATRRRCTERCTTPASTAALGMP